MSEKFQTCPHCKIDKFMTFLKEQDPPFPCGIYEGWFETDGGVISVQKLEIFLRELAKKSVKD